MQDITTVSYGLFDRATGELIQSGTARRCDLTLFDNDDAKAVEGDFPLGATLTPDGSVANPPPASPVLILPAMVKAAAARRLRRTDWYSIRASEPGGDPIPADVLAARAHIRARSDVIEAMSPIPQDFDDARYWA